MSLGKIGKLSFFYLKKSTNDLNLPTMLKFEYWAEFMHSIMARID